MESLRKIISRYTKPFYFTRLMRVDLRTSLKNNQHGVSVANIILSTDNSKLNAKRCKFNQFLFEYVMKKRYLSH